MAALVERARKSGKGSLKEIVNEALRRGLTDMIQPAGPGEKPYRTPGVDLGRCLIGNIDDVSEAIAVAEGDRFR